MSLPDRPKGEYRSAQHEGTPMTELTRIVVGPRVQAQWHDGSTVDVTGKPAMLLAMVALEGHAERRRLAALLWPDSAPQQALNNLRTLVHRLNQRFGGELVTGAEHLRIDSAQAHVTLQGSDELLAALGAGGAERCELLAEAGIEAGAAEALDHWLEAARQRLRHMQLAGLGEALGQALAENRAERAVALARACVQLEPLSEQWHRQLMDTLVRCGDRAAALVAYEGCKTRLRQALGVMPDLQTRAVHLRILQDQALDESIRQAPDPVPVQPAAAVAVTARLTLLGGAARYPLIEREAVLAEVQAALVQGQHVALHGEAGVGKTRLLRQLAEQAEPRCIEQVVIRPGARNEPYAALAQVLQDVQPRRAPRIGMPEQIELARLAPLAFAEVQPSQAALSAPRLHAALRHWIGRLGDAGMKRLVLDDVHYADAASQAAFAALLEPPEDAGPATPALLLAHRTDEIDAALAEALLAAQVRRQARTISLARLSLHGVQALLQAMHSDQSAAEAARLLQRTGGNPLFLIELAEHGREQAEQIGAGLAGANLEALLRSRLALCSSAAQQLATVAAVAAADFSVELAAAVTGQPPLALMPAWKELQQRGLFADNGLAHDLIRDAVMGALPAAIGRTLHRQVASHLEGLGTRGSRVLRHWLAAEDADHALPHAVHQLHAAAAAGLRTVTLEIELLALLGRVSDAVLLDYLWLTADLKDVPVHGDWSALTALVARVERLGQTEAVAQWLAFERARLLGQRDSQLAKAYAELSEATQHLSGPGVGRAWIEIRLGNFALQLNAQWARAHVMRAKAAVTGLPEKPEYRRLRSTLERTASLCLDDIESLRSKRADIRSARRRHDLGAVAVERYELAVLCVHYGLFGSACRLFRVDSRASLTQAALQDVEVDHFGLAVPALVTGRFSAALRFFDSDLTEVDAEIRQIGRTLLWLRLGQWLRAKDQAESINATLLDSLPQVFLAYALARRDIDLHEGADPLPRLREIVDRARRLGVGGANLKHLEWQVAQQTLPAEERIASGAGLIEHLRSAHSHSQRLPIMLLEVAEAHAQAGSAGGRALALEAARGLRRGRATHLYLPEGLVRCARLLAPTDPLEAASLMHVAQRWVRQAWPHVPEFARESFATEVPINRLLLGDDPAVAFLKGRA